MLSSNAVFHLTEPNFFTRHFSSEIRKLQELQNIASKNFRQDLAQKLRRQKSKASYLKEKFGLGSGAASRWGLDLQLPERPYRGFFELRACLQKLTSESDEMLRHKELIQYYDNWYWCPSLIHTDTWNERNESPTNNFVVLYVPTKALTREQPTKIRNQLIKQQDLLTHISIVAAYIINSLPIPIWNYHQEVEAASRRRGYLSLHHPCRLQTTWKPWDSSVDR